MGSIGDNPGGLQNFRLGVNRNNDNSFLGFIDNVQIWNDANQDPAAIFAAGPGINQIAIPEPASLAIWSLVGLSLAGFGYYRTRRKK